MGSKNNEAHSNETRLSILIAQDGFSFFVRNAIDSESVFIPKTIVKDINSAKSLSFFKSQLSKCFKTYSITSIYLSFSNPYFSIIPTEYFDQSALTDYLKYNVELYENDHVVSDEISVINANQVFIPLMNYHNLVLEFVEEFEFNHFTNVLITNSYPLNTAVQCVKAFIHDSHIEVVAFDKGVFKLCNYFTIATDVDIVYYILFCVEELGFSQKEMQLEVYHANDESSWKAILDEYIANIDCIPSNLVEYIS